MAPEGCYSIQAFATLPKFPHSYHVINKLDFPIFEENWSAREELLLFEGLGKHGFGNWNQIAEHIDTNKTRDATEEHYTKIYLEAPNFLPEINVSLLKRQKSGYRGHRASQQNSKKQNKEVKNRITTNSQRVKTKQEPNKKDKPATVEVVGYMPLRKDFQFEYDNEAELLLAEMEFGDEDTPEEIQLKFKTIEIYNRRLTERNKKKQFVISRNLLDLEKQTNLEKTRTKNEKQIYNMMKVFSRFQTAEDHEQLVQGLIQEKNLRQTIEELKDMRNRGFHTKVEIEAELERKKEAKSKKKSSNDYGYALGNYDQARNRRLKDQLESNPIPSKHHNLYFSPEEIDLCKNLKIAPMAYMMIKETIIREYIKAGHSLDRETILGLFTLEKYVINSIINGMVSRKEIICRG